MTISSPVSHIAHNLMKKKIYNKNSIIRHRNILRIFEGFLVYSFVSPSWLAADPRFYGTQAFSFKQCIEYILWQFTPPPLVEKK